MTLVWDGEAIQAYDLDQEIPGPRAEEIAALLEPGYLRGYLEGRRKDVAFRGKPGRDFHQLQKMLRSGGRQEKRTAPWRYATFLRERLLQITTSKVVTTTSGEVVSDDNTTSHKRRERN